MVRVLPDDPAPTNREGPRPNARRLSLRRQVLVPLLTTGLLLFLIVSWVGSQIYKQLLVDQLNSKARMLADTIHSAAGVMPHSSYLQRMVDATAADGDVASVIVVWGDPPRIIACTDRRWLDRPVSEVPDVAAVSPLLTTLHTQSPVESVGQPTGLYQYVAPLHWATAADTSAAGAVLVRIDSKATARALLRSIVIGTLLALTTISILWLLAWILLNRHVLAPLAKITQALEQRGASGGELELPSLPPNEIGSLAAALKQAFHSLIESEQRAQLALRELALQRQALDEHAILSETDARGRIVYANRKFCELSGYEYHEVLGQDHRILNSGVHPPSFWKEMYAALARHGVWHGEICNRTKNGELYWVQTTNAAISDPQGRILGYVSLRTDITERRRAEQANRRLAARLQAILKHAGHAIISTDSDGIIQVFNPAAESMLGYSADEVIGQRSPLIFHDPQELRERAAALSLELGRPIESHNDLFWHLFTTRAQMEWTYVRKDGTRVPVLLSLSPLTDSDGTMQGYMGVASDISEQKRVESEIRSAKDELEQANKQLAQALEHTRQLALAAKQATAAKSEFLANMSHEIRTPMTAILGYTDLLIEQDEATGRPRSEALQTIRRNGLHLLEIINDILDLSKIEAGRMELERVDVPLWQLLEDIRGLMRVRAEQKGIDLDIRALTPLPSHGNTDPVRLRQVLVNLVGNAIKFTEQGRVTVSMAYEAIEARGILHIYIDDTGIGISPEEMNRLFHPFSQADTSMTRRFGGTGLGLTISKRLIGLLGGQISVESKRGRGSRFTVTLDIGAAVPPEQRHFPCYVPPQPAAALDAATPPAVPLEEPQLKGPAAGRILLAEDGPDNQRLIGLVLRKSNYEVTVAENGRIAIETYRQAAAAGMPYDLILMDMQMPEMDGYTATQQLRQLGCQVPIIALTAHAMTGDREKCLAAGCDEYLSKPIDRQQLVATIQAVLHAQPQNDAMEPCAK